MIRCIGVVISDHVLVRSVTSALQSHVSIVCCLSQASFRILIARTPLALILTELSDNHGISALPFLRSLRSLLPAVPIIGVVSPSLRDLHEVPAAVRAGLTDFLIPGCEDPWPIVRASLSTPSVMDTEHAVLSLVRPVVTDHAWPIIERSISAAARGLNVSQLSHSIGVSTRALVRAHAREGLPGPHTLISFMRVVLAAHLIETHGLRVQQIAPALFFSSIRQFRRTVYGATGLRESDLSRPGMTVRLIARFAEMSAAAARAPSQRERDSSLAGDVRMIDAPGIFAHTDARSVFIQPSQEAGGFPTHRQDDAKQA
jgi:hypothetical protein